MRVEVESVGSDEVFAALANPTRREVLRLLLAGPRPVNALAAHFAMRRPSLSEHLRVLRDAGLVTEQKHGRERHYQLEPEPLMTVRDWIAPYEHFWRERLKVLQDILDEERDG